MSSTKITPYLFFDGNCEEAIQFYIAELGAILVMQMRYEQSPVPMPPESVKPGSDKKIMHASLMLENNLLMMSDDCSGGKVDHSGCRLTLSVSDAEQANRFFNALSQEGRVEMPLSKTFWSPCYGMVTDKFGVGWMVMVNDPQGSERD